MRRNEFLQLFAHAAPATVRCRAVDEHGKRIDRITIDEDRHLYEIALAVIDDVVVEGSIALGDRLQAVVKVEHHFVERQFIGDHGAVADIGQLRLDAATVLAKLQNATEIFIRRHDRRLDPRLSNIFDLHHIRHVRRVVKFLLGAIRQGHFVDDRRGSGDEVEIELALKTLLNDFQMQKTEEAATEAEAEGCGAFHFEGEGRVVQAKLADGGAQIFEVCRIDREETAEHHRLGRLETGQGLFRRTLVIGDRVTDARVGHFLDRGGDEADFARSEAIHGKHLRRQNADALDRILGTRAHHADLLALGQHAIDDAHQNHDAEIGVVPAIDEQRLKRTLLTGFALGRGQLVNDGFQNIGNAKTGLGRNHHGFGGIDADDFLDLFLDAIRLCSRQVDLVEHRDDLVIVVDRLIDVGERLRFHALRGIHHQKRAFAGR